MSLGMATPSVEELEAEIEFLLYRLDELKDAARDAHYEGYMAGVGDSEDYDHDPTVMEKEAWADYEGTDDE